MIYTVELNVFGQKVKWELLVSQMQMLLGMNKRRYKNMSNKTISTTVFDSDKCACMTNAIQGILPIIKVCNMGNGFNPNDVVNVEFYPPAVKMFFRDGTITVATPYGDDKYDPEMGMIICILKYIWGDKGYNNFFRKWIKKDKALQEAKKALEVEKQEEKERIAKKVAKNAERKRKRAEAKKERDIEVMAEAIRRANGVTPEAENNVVKNEDA